MYVSVPVRMHVCVRGGGGEGRVRVCVSACVCVCMCIHVSLYRAGYILIDVPRWDSQPVDMYTATPSSVTVYTPTVNAGHPVESLLFETRYKSPVNAEWTSWEQALDLEVSLTPTGRRQVLPSLLPSTTYQIRVSGVRRSGSLTRPSTLIHATTLGKGNTTLWTAAAGDFKLLQNCLLLSYVAITTAGYLVIAY